MSNTVSLFDELTRLRKPDFPVSEVLTRLLKVVGHDVCLAKRNHHGVYWALSQARDVCEDINGLIPVADEGDSWDAFNEYTVKVLSIEGILLNFSLIAERESAAARFADSGSVVTDLAFIDLWRENRKALRDVFQQLVESKCLKGDAAQHTRNIKAIHRQDDLALFRAVYLRLLDYVKSTPAPAKENVSSIIKQLDGIHTTLSGAPETLSDDFVVYAIQFAMMIEIFVSARDKKLAARIQDPKWWETTFRQIKLFDNILDPKLGESFLLEWTKIIDDLTGKTWIATMPIAYKDLRGLIARIRRPYYWQSVGLVSGCAELAYEFDGDKSFEKLNPFTRALEEVTAALQAATKVAYDPMTPFQEDIAVAKSFVVAEDSVRQCFQEYELPVDKFERRMTHSRETDSERLKHIEARFKAQKPDRTLNPTVDIVVNVSTQGSRSATPHKYTMESALTLHAILWKEASLLQNVEKASVMRNKAWFQSPTERLGLDTVLATLPERNGAKVVALVVPA